MHLRSGLVVASLIVLSACGLSDSEPDRLAPPTEPETTTTSAPATTEPQDAVATTVSIPELNERDLAEALPDERDLPDDYFEVEVEIEDEFGEEDPFAEEVRIEASPECDAMMDRIDALTLDVPTFTSFANVDEVSLDATVALAGPDERAAFDQLDQIAACATYREIYSETEAVTYALSSRPLELGELAFVTDVTATPEGIDEPPSGFTTISVLHGDVVFTVDLYDGFSTTETIPRDPALAMTIAELMDEKVGEIQAD